MSKNNCAKFNTLLVHAGEKPDLVTGAVAPVLVRSKTFAQADFGGDPPFQYSRGSNPTRNKLEEKLAALEGGGEATVFGSGVAALASFFLTLNRGDHILFCQEVYGGTFRLIDKLLSRFGLEADFVDFTSERNIKRYIKPNTKYLFIETPTNPSFNIIDLKLVKRVSAETGIPYAADMTFAPPCTTKVLDYGAETVIQSLSKYIAGHNDVLGGAVITKNKELHEQLKFMQRTLGAVLSPDECYRILQGVKTLALRFNYVSQSAQTVAEFLAEQPAVEKVLYPGLPNHPGYYLAEQQMTSGFGGVLSFTLRERKFSKLKKFVDQVRQSGCIIYGESLASPETIIAYPPLMSHKSLPEVVRLSLDITDGFFRLSLGFEDTQDIISALKSGLEVL